MTSSNSISTPPDTPILEVEQIDSLIAAAGADGVRQIMDAFWRSAEQLLAALKTQIEADDFAEACRTAHAIKGASLNVGATRLAAAARAVEEGCQARDRTALEASHDAASQSLRATRQAVGDRLQAA